MCTVVAIDALLLSLFVIIYLVSYALMFNFHFAQGTGDCCPHSRRIILSFINAFPGMHSDVYKK